MWLNPAASKGGAGAMHLYSFVVLLLSFKQLVLCQEVRLPAGHLKPLGSHMEAQRIEELSTFPDPLTFQYSYVQKNKPVKLNGLLKTTDVLNNWQNDDYLRYST